LNATEVISMTPNDRQIIADLRAAGLDAAQRRRNVDPSDQVGAFIRDVTPPEDFVATLDRYAAGGLAPGDQATAEAAAAAAADIREQL
jgi:hypothetical protein